MPSSTYPPPAFFAATIASRTMSRTISSGTNSPWSRRSWTATPSAVLAATWSRSRSPVAMCGIAKWAAITAPCVPFPAPGGAIISTRIAVLSRCEASTVRQRGLRRSAGRAVGPLLPGVAAEQRFVDPRALRRGARHVLLAGRGNPDDLVDGPGGEPRVRPPAGVLLEVTDLLDHRRDG